MSKKTIVLGILLPVLAISLWSGGLMVRSALASPPALAPASQRADFVEVDKSDRELRLLRDGDVIRRYPVSLGFAPEGDKFREGDGKTPEGRYTIDYRNPNSRFHLSLHISYPDASDKAEAAARGDDPGGEIFIHGGPKGVPDALWRGEDWTLGCVSVTNDQITEIWSLVPDGTPIEITP
jgi:murein L,D-transpeptidase YafK